MCTTKTRSESDTTPTRWNPNGHTVSLHPVHFSYCWPVTRMLRNWPKYPRTWCGMSPRMLVPSPCSSAVFPGTALGSFGGAGAYSLSREVMDQVSRLRLIIREVIPRTLQDAAASSRATRLRTKRRLRPDPASSLYTFGPGSGQSETKEKPRVRNAVTPESVNREDPRPLARRYRCSNSSPV